MEYRYNCCNPLLPEELELIIDSAEEISAEEFKEAVGEANWNEANSLFLLPLDEDYAVSFEKSIGLKGQKVYLFKHSAIEYIYY